MPDDSMIERLAALEHEQWTHWTRYMIANWSPGNRERWRQQTDTPYSELSEAEKSSDRDWAKCAIEEIREPTEAMVTAGIDASPLFYERKYGQYSGKRISIDTDQAAKVWRAMIDAILNEEQDDADTPDHP